LVRDYRDKVQFLAVGSVDTADQIEDFVSYYGLKSVPTAIDTDGSLRTSIGVPGHPAWAFIDEDGGARVVVGSVFDPVLIDEVEELVTA
jgi:hypothetical protein